jgi:hypothetical protein
MAVNLVSRVQKILMSPKTEWDVIDTEPADMTGIITSYILPLVAIGAIASVLAVVIFAGGAGAIVGLLVGLIVALIIGVAAVFLFAFLFNVIAAPLGATANFGQAFKLAAYFPTAYWVASIVAIIPVPIVAALVVLAAAAYSLYTLFLGAPKLMKAPADKAMTYGLACIGVVIVVGVVVWLVLRSVGGMGMTAGLSGCTQLAQDVNARMMQGKLPTADEQARLQQCARDAAAAYR